MKNFLGLALLATVFTTSAFASVARLEALGEDQFGSQYINDNRNMFLNASATNEHFDFATFEWGNTERFLNSEDAGSNAATLPNGPKAQGGIFKKNGDLVYGIYFGADSNTASRLRSAGLIAGGLTNAFAPTLASLAQNENTLDLFVGGENSVKWGVRVSHASGSSDQAGTAFFGASSPYTDYEKTGTLIGLGLEQGNNSFYANVGVGNEFKVSSTLLNAEGGKYHFKGQIGYQVGYVRSLGNGAKAWVEYQQQDAEEEEISTLDETQEASKMLVGWGKESKLNDTFTAFYKAIYSSEKQENRGFVSTNEDLEESFLRATFGFEVIVKEWLTLRGSIANNLMGETNYSNAARTTTAKDSKTIADSTEVNLGATLAFGDFGIDGLIGNDANGNGVAGGAGDDNGQIRTDSLMSRVSMTYKF
jgi:hypothetical protein